MGWFKHKESDKERRQRIAQEQIAAAAAYTSAPSVKQTDYIAPVPVPPDEPVIVRPPPVTEEPPTEDQGEMVMVSNHRGVADDGLDEIVDVENTTSSFSRGTESDPGRVPMRYQQMQTGGKQTHLNSLFNGHLMKWKFAAEEGTAFIRIPVFFGAIGLLATAIVAVVLYPEAWEPHSIVMTVGVVIMSLFILILEGRFLITNPLSARAHLRNIITRNFNVLRFLWGRGILYIIAGTLNVAQTWLITIISGSVMIAFGFLSIFVGIHASRKFAALRNSLADESFLVLIFGSYDSDGDGYLEAYQFARLLSYLGMELDDRYTLKAFNAIDREGNRKVSYEDFSNWWTAGYIERGRRQTEFADDES